MRQLIKVLLIITIISLLITGCSKSSTQKNDEIVMGFIYIGPIGDGGWTYAQDQARVRLEQELGIKTIYQENVAEGPEVKDIVRNMIDQGANIISAGSFGYMDYIEEISHEYPEVKFLHCSGYKTTENMANYFGRIYEARYLSGIVAGLKTKVNKIGYVAAFEIPEVIRGINAFTLGVQSVNKDAKVNVVWTHTWYDPAKEKEAAKALLDDKCDVIAMHQDTAGPLQAAQEYNAWAIGYNTNQYSKAPKAFMTAPIWDWVPYYTEQINAIRENRWEPHSYWGGMADGIVTLVPLTENAPEEANEIINNKKQQIINGTYTIFKGPIKDQNGTIKVPEGVSMTDAELLSINWFVHGVEGKLESN
ncbi:MAG: BMP family ABC transporter substrate-binding protein [Candidatus Cloacimonetes bacterium]|jgi:basic membrane protein A|nr:BMP family ABC transporter substrate-binding protein [Candidatus Cloacimonadota bacterium]